MTNYQLELPQGEHTAHNVAEVARWKDDPWWYAINYAHNRLTTLDPNYRVNQIKAKFGGLRYYVAVSDPDLQARAMAITAEAEAWVDGYETGLRHAGGKETH